MHTRDVCALATRKLLRRWVRTALSVIAVAAALAPLAVVSSLQDGVRDGIIRLLLCESPPPGYSLVRALTPREAGWYGAPLLSRDDLERLAARKGVEWVREVSAVPSTMLRLDDDNHAWYLAGCPLEFIRSQARIDLPEGSDAPIPVLLTRQVSLQFWNEKEQRPDYTEADARDYVGRDLELVVGDYVGKEEAWVYTRHHVRKRTEEELAAARKEHLAGLATRYDLEKLGTGRVLKARVVGVSPLWGMTLVPSEEAKRWTEWRIARDKAARRPGAMALPDPGDFDVDTALLKVARGTDPLSLERSLKTEGFFCTSFELEREEAIERLGVVIRIVRYAAAAVMLLGLIVVAVTLSKIASDSERDIGLYRAVGATRWQVMSVFVAQAVLIGIVGGAVGILGGNLAARWMSEWAIRSAGAQQVTQYVGIWWRSAMMEALPKTFYRFAPIASAGILCAGLCVCVLASLVPSLRAAWKDPIRALRSE